MAEKTVKDSEEWAELQRVHQELERLYTNLIKDNQERRFTPEVIARKSEACDVLKQRLVNAYQVFTESKPKYTKLVEIVTKVVNSANKLHGDIRKILNERLRQVTEIDVDLSIDVNINKMAEKFCLKTAGSLLPVMDDSENVTIQLIDAIEMYEKMLNEEGKSFLIMFVLKSCVSCTELVSDLKKHFITKKSAIAISMKLHNLKQGSQTLDQYGR